MIKEWMRLALVALLVAVSGAGNAGVDPVGPDTHSGQNFNRYHYASNNPYRFTDPDGRQVREVNFETANSGYEPPPRSPDDWLGPAIGVGLTGVVAAPVVGFAATTPLGAAALKAGVEIGMGDALGGASLAASGATLFRVVDGVELSSIQEVGRFLPSPNGDSVKRFVDSASGARALADTFTRAFGGPQYVVQGRATQGVMDAAVATPFSDVPGRGMKSINVPVSQLPYVQFQNRVDAD